MFWLMLSFVMSGFSAGDSLLTHTVEVPGFGEIRYRPPVVENEELPIVLFHGIYGGASHRTWRALLPELDNAGQRVFVMDLPGVGESDKPKRAYSVEDFDLFVEKFLLTVVKQRATVVSESILSASVLRVSAERPDLIRRTILLNPSGVNSLNEPPSEREQGLYQRLFNDDPAAIAFYKNLLQDNSLRFFLRFGFYDDSLVDEALLADFRVMRENIDQRFLTLSFVGGQLYRSFQVSAEGVFIPVLAVFGKEYEAFQDREPATAADFASLRPDFSYVEIPESGASVQREKPEEVAKQILIFSEDD